MNKSKLLIIILLSVLLLGPIVNVKKVSASNASTHVSPAAENYKTISKYVVIGWITKANTTVDNVTTINVNDTSGSESINGTIFRTYKMNITVTLIVRIPINITITYPENVTQGENVTINVYLDIQNASILWIVSGYIYSKVEANLTTYEDSSLAEEIYVMNELNITVNGSSEIPLDEPIGYNEIDYEFENASALKLANGTMTSNISVIDHKESKTHKANISIDADVLNEFSMQIQHETALNMTLTAFDNNSVIKNFTMPVSNDDQGFTFEIPTEGITGNIGLNLTFTYMISQFMVVVNELKFKTELDNEEFESEVENEFSDILEDAVDELLDMEDLMEIHEMPDFEEHQSEEYKEEYGSGEGGEEQEEEEMENGDENNHDNNSEEENTEEVYLGSEYMFLITGFRASESNQIESTAPTDEYAIAVTTIISVAEASVYTSDTNITNVLPILAVLASLVVIMYAVIRKNSKKF